MARVLNTKTLNGAARYYASLWVADSKGKFSREFVKNEFWKFTFKDEFDYLVNQVGKNLGVDDRESFMKMINTWKKEDPRKDEKLEELLAQKLAVDKNGKHIPGLVGTTVLSEFYTGNMVVSAPLRNGGNKLVREKGQLLAGMKEEGLMPEQLLKFQETMALNTRISNECAILACDAVVDNLDEGSLGCIAVGYSGSQPTDPDTAPTGTKLFTCQQATTTSFGGAVDAAPGAIATANSYDDDTSADASLTLGYVRVSSSSVALTALDDHIDGEAGTASADWIFNTLDITSGSTVSITSHTVTMPES